MYTLNENIEEISSTIEQPPAGTEEMADSSEETNTTSLEVENHQVCCFKSTIKYHHC